MSAFPQLKTGAVLQYPARKALDFSTKALRFIDGSEQRFRKRKSPIHRWAVRLELLDETELRRLKDFFISMNGAHGTFTFTDPWDAIVYPDCSVENAEAAFELQGEARGLALLLVRENRT